MAQPGTPEHLEAVLLQLLQPDSAIINEYTQQLKAVLKTPNGVALLVQVLSGSQHVGVRQMAAVLLRQRIIKVWLHLPGAAKETIKDTLLRQVLQDPARTVQHAIAGVISVIAKHEVPTNQWPNFMPWLNTCNHSQTPLEREIGMYVLSSLCETMGAQLKRYLPSLFELFAAALQDSQSPSVPLFTIKTITELTEHLGDKEMHLVRGVLPLILQVIRNTLGQDEQEAVTAMQFFDELIDMDVPLKGEEVKGLIGFFLEVAANRNLENTTRVTALSHIMFLTNSQSKFLASSGLVGDILNHVFPIMAEADGEEEEDEDDDVEIPASRFAAQIIDTFALNLPPTAVVGPALQLVGQASQSPDPHHRKAAMVTLMVLAEGCSEALCKILTDILPVLYRGLEDSEVVVREAACLALSQFAQYLQPDISDHCDAVLSRLFLSLDSSSNELREKSCYALQTFAEQLGERVVPYVPAMMKQLHSMLVGGTRPVQEVAVLAVAAVAASAGPAFEPYVGEVFGLLKQLMSSTSEETTTLRAHATDAIGAIVKGMGRPYFEGQLADLMAVSMAGLELEDPEITQCTFGLWASLASVFRDDFAGYLPQCVPHIMAMVESTEGVVQHRATDDNTVNIDSGDEDEGEVESCTVIAAYMDAKETAINALASLAEDLPHALVPTMEPMLPVLLDLLAYKFSAEVKKAAATCLVQFVVSVCIVFPSAAPWVAGLPVQVPLSAQGNAIVETVMPRLVSIMQADEDRLVVLAVCEALRESLIKIGPAAIANFAEAWVTTVSRLVQGQATCQNIEIEDDEDAEHSVAEYDSMLIETACELIGVTAKLCGPTFQGQYMDHFLKLLLRFYRKKSAPSERSVCMATIADVIEGMGSAVVPYVETLYTTLHKGLSDAEPEVRSNAAFALGLLAQHAGPTLQPHYLALLQALHPLFSNQPQPEATDNACGAVCRMIMAGPDCLPLQQVLPVLVAALPLKADFEENDVVFHTIFTLIRAANPTIFQLLPQLLPVFAHVLAHADKQLKAPVRDEMVAVVRQLYAQYPGEMAQAVGGMDPQSQQVIAAALQ